MIKLSSNLLALCLCACATAAAAQPPAPAPPKVERLSATRFRVGRIEVDRAKREISVPATVNSATILEFVANTLGGFKAYESALTVQSNAITFNTALLLIGLDKARSKPPRWHFDPDPPQGDPVDIWVEWNAAGGIRRVRVEELLWDKRTSATLPPGPWVYTGSTFIPNGGPYAAEADGVLIGFVHSPAPVIENPRPGAVGAFGAVIFNEQLGLKPDTAVTLIVAAAAPTK